MKLQADNITGVYKVEEFEGEVLSQQDFYDALSTNPDESIICAEVDSAMAEKIEDEYGIQNV